MITGGPTPTVKFKGKTFLEKNAGPDKVLRTVDASGTLEWKDITEVFTIFPIGTILQIPVETYNDTHFHTVSSSTYTETITTVNNQATGLIDVRLRVGAGKATSQWKGWYVCNGKTWTGGTADTQTSYVFPHSTTPNLNNVYYRIELPAPDLGLSDLDCEGCGGFNAVVSEYDGKNKPDYILGAQRHGLNILYSSVDSRFDLSTPTPSQSYSHVRYTEEAAVTAEGNFYTGGITNTNFNIKASEISGHKNRSGEAGISIIYLGKIDLYWYHETQNNWVF